MNTPLDNALAPKDMPDQIVVFLQVPGMSMSGLACLILCPMLEEPIRQALAREGLITLISPAPEAKLFAEGAARQIMDNLAGLSAAQRLARPDTAASDLPVPPLAALSATARDYFLRIMECGAVWTISGDNWFMLTATTSDTARALPVVKSVLENLSLLQYSQIGVMGEGEKVCRTFFPEFCEKPIDRHTSRVAPVISEMVKHLQSLPKLKK